MSQTHIASLVFDRLSDVELIDFINQFTPIKNEQILVQIEDELKERKFNYQHLINHKNELQLQQPLRLIDGNLFELNIPKPPMVGTFYKNVRQLIDFLQNSPFLKGKNLVTFDYILDQFYATKNDVQIITNDDLAKLSNDNVFIGFKNSLQTFPNKEILDQISHLDTLILIDKGPFYRGIKQATVYKNNKIVDQWQPLPIKDID